MINFIFECEHKQHSEIFIVPAAGFAWGCVRLYQLSKLCRDLSIRTWCVITPIASQQSHWNLTPPENAVLLCGDGSWHRKFAVNCVRLHNCAEGQADPGVVDSDSGGHSRALILIKFVTSDFLAASTLERWTAGIISKSGGTVERSQSLQTATKKQLKRLI